MFELQCNSLYLIQSYTAFERNSPWRISPETKITIEHCQLLKQNESENSNIALSASLADVQGKRLLLSKSRRGSTWHGSCRERQDLTCFITFVSLKKVLYTKSPLRSIVQLRAIMRRIGKEIGKKVNMLVLPGFLS
jgi:hypothetical protein